MPIQKRGSQTKGKDGNKGKKAAPKKKTDTALPADTKCNETQKQKGTCVYYNKSGGYGFIKLDKEGVVPEDKVMVYWKEIQSDDAWPFLHKGLEVEFKLKKFMKANGSGCYIKAQHVTLPNGKKVDLQAGIDSQREFIHSQSTRFTGVVKFYDVEKGFGYVTMEDGYANVEHVPKELRIIRSQIRVASEAPFLTQGLKVEFGIVKNLKDQWGCFGLTLPGGETVTRAVAEGRSSESKTNFKGSVAFYDFRKGFGYITPDAGAKFPAKIQSSLDESLAKAKKRLEKQGKDKKAGGIANMIYFRRGDCNHEGRINRGDKCEFQLYSDNKGIGAHQLKIAA